MLWLKIIGISILLLAIVANTSLFNDTNNEDSILSLKNVLMVEHVSILLHQNVMSLNNSISILVLKLKVRHLSLTTSRLMGIWVMLMLISTNS